MQIKKVVTLLVILLLPSYLVVLILRLLGHKIQNGCRVGFSIVWIDYLVLSENARIGHFNLLILRRLILRNKAVIGRANVMVGPISILLKEQGAIGNSNKIVRGPLNLVVTGGAQLKLGKLTKITSNHRLDCTKSIIFGDFSILAGVGSQIWTHGYVHELQGAGRYRIDGRVAVGNNVYIGASCILNAGIQISNGIMIGAGAVVGRDLYEEGLYVSSSLRKLQRPISPDDRIDLCRSQDSSLCERVYVKQKK